MASTEDDEWRNLLESSTNLNLSHTTSRINRSLRGIEKEAQRLSSKSSRHVPANQLKDFAAQAGVDIRNQSQYIASIDTLPMAPQKRDKKRDKQRDEFRPQNIPLISGSIHPTNTMDLANFLKYHHEYVISSTIQECQLLSSTHFRKKYCQSIQNEWNNTKNEILNYFGCDHNNNQQMQMQYQPNISILNSTMNDNTMNSSQMQHDITMNNSNINNGVNISKNLQIQLRESLSKIICDLSLYRNITSPIIDFNRNTNQQQTNIFSAISEIGIIHRQLLEEHVHKNQSNPDNFEYLCDLWQCLSSIIFEKGLNEQNECYLRENEYATYVSNNSIGLQRFLAFGSRKYLEKMYFNFMQKEIANNKIFAKKGGKPGKRYIILAYVRLKYKNGTIIPAGYAKVSINSEIFPLFALIYYSYRIGDMDSAIYFASLSQTAQIMYESLCDLRQKRFESFHHYSDLSQIIAYYDSHSENLDSEIWKNKLDLYYKENIVCREKCADPFEQCMYILIGKLFSSETFAGVDEVMNRSEDFLWYKLSTLYFRISEKPQWIDNSNCCGQNIWNPCLTLAALQDEIKNSIGPNQFDNKIVFVISLILSQQFEDSIKYLSKIGYTMQSIHIAICLKYYGLIDTQQMNKTEMLNYLMQFKNQNQNESIFYYLYMCDELQGKLIHFLCQPNKELRQLVLGKMGADAIDIHNSLLYKFMGNLNIDKYIQICQLSAKRAYENGEIEHCIILYILSGDFNLSAQICLKLLSSHISDKAHNQSKQYIINLAKHLFTSNKQMQQNDNFHSLSLINKSLIKQINHKNSINLICCIHFAEFYNFFYDTDAHEKALLIILKNGMIPINDENVINLNNQIQNINQMLKPYRERVLNLDNDLKKYIAEICVAVMKILHLQFQTTQNRKQIKNAQNISTKCYIIYNFFNSLEAQIKPIGAGDTAKNISNLYFQTRMD